MFGYLVAATEALSEEEFARYRACYCGLCRSIRERHGQAAGLANPGPPPPLQTKGPGPLSRRRRTENQPAQAQVPRDASPPSLRSPPGCWGL